ncbi:MAG: sulfatase family protein [Cyclobacteriaceae bacterium]
MKATKQFASVYILFASTCFCCSPNKSDLSTADGQQPNIVWITSEDNSKHYMSLFDPNGVETPEIKALADHGLIFTHAFSNTPVCSAARSTLIAGSYGPRLASHYHRKMEKVPLPDGVEMFPAYLRKAGYYATNNSKEDYNFNKADDVWDESSKTASWRNRKEDQPFFHVANFTTTHESRLHFSEEQMDSLAPKTDDRSFAIQPNHPQTALFKYTNAVYRDSIQMMDKKVGAVVDQLEADGLLENTFIFYFGDHGGVLPGSKGYIYETGIHVPLVVYIPPKYKHMVDKELGSKVDGFVSFIDFGVTALNIAGIEIPIGMDGIPFLGSGVEMSEMNSRDETYSYADRHDEKYDMVRAVRKGKYKYIRNYQPFNFDGLMNNYRYKQLAYKEWLGSYEKGELNEVQSQFFYAREPELLFDIEADPFETQNLAHDDAYKEVLTSARRKLFDWEKQMPDLSFYPEFYLISNAFANPVQFGQQHKAEIENYINIANLSLLEFEEAKSRIEKGLKSSDPWVRYWALIVCSSFGSGANELASTIAQIAAADSENINKVRAAEFLGLAKAEGPSKVMLEALYESKDGPEGLLILNSIVLMKDGPHKYAFDIDYDKIPSSVKDNSEVQRRLDYLNVGEGES